MPTSWPASRTPAARARPTCCTPPCPSTGIATRWSCRGCWSTSSERYDAVVSDNQAGGYRSAWFLIRQGHRHIGVVGCHPRAYPSIRQRQQGYLRALADAGLSTAYLAECHIADAEEVRRATARLLADHPEITAILAANDETAIAALDAARGLGRHVPGDLSLVGFDNIDLAARIAPPLTTMHVDKVGMGRMAVQLLANRLAHPEASPVTASIRPTWIERDSVRAIDGGPRASAPEEESPS
ncbi:MAG: substrate-binding domain-containing protein [Anaerolineae bacterium]